MYCHPQPCIVTFAHRKSLLHSLVITSLHRLQCTTPDRPLGCVHGVCQLAPGQLLTPYGTYASDVQTVCSCSQGWIGTACNVSCPCYFGQGVGSKRGDCVLVPSLLPGGATGECACHAGWVGTDCSVQCPSCNEHGTCTVPPQLPGGLTQLLTRLSALSAAVRALGATPLASALAALPDWGLLSSLGGYVSGIVQDVNGVYSAASATVVTGRCACDVTSVNNESGIGYTGFNCTVPCAPCKTGLGKCAYDGSCSCNQGLAGPDCSKVCNGNGILFWPTLNSTYTSAQFDAQVLSPA